MCVLLPIHCGRKVFQSFLKIGTSIWNPLGPVDHPQTCLYLFHCCFAISSPGWKAFCPPPPPHILLGALFDLHGLLGCPYFGYNDSVVASLHYKIVPFRIRFLILFIMQVISLLFVRFLLIVHMFASCCHIVSSLPFYKNVFLAFFFPHFFSVLHLIQFIRFLIPQFSFSLPFLNVTFLLFFCFHISADSISKLKPDSFLLTLSLVYEGS